MIVRCSPIRPGDPKIVDLPFGIIQISGHQSSYNVKGNYRISKLIEQ